MTFLLTMPGVPFVYYGDEIGMRYLPDWPEKEGSIMGRNANRSGSRTPMQWTAGRTAGFSDGDSASLYLPLDPDPLRPTVAAQEDDPVSLLNYVGVAQAIARAGDTGRLAAGQRHRPTLPDGL